MGEPSRRVCNTFDCCSVQAGPTCEICTTDGLSGSCIWCAATSTCLHKSEEQTCAQFWAGQPSWCANAEDGIISYHTIHIICDVHV